MGEIVLDTSVEPPVIRFNNASVRFLFGDTDEAGKFVPFTHELSATRHLVNGEYSGPGSEPLVS